MSFASCSQFEHGYFTAYRHLAADEPELVLHLGDYQYEYPRTRTPSRAAIRATIRVRRP
jgi:phosphodiesterase/alkaline phosphatase D-like protein